MKVLAFLVSCVSGAALRGHFPFGQGSMAVDRDQNQIGRTSTQNYGRPFSTTTQNNGTKSILTQESIGEPDKIPVILSALRNLFCVVMHANSYRDSYVRPTSPNPWCLWKYRVWYNFRRQNRLQQRTPRAEIGRVSVEQHCCCSRFSGPIWLNSVKWVLGNPARSATAEVQAPTPR